MRKIKKFADGGSDKYKARYDRKVADIESDYEKSKDRKTGRDAEVAKAKYEQRMADAKDDLAKWTKSDRTATRAGEKAAEKNLSMTRKFGARSSEGQVAKAEEKLADKTSLSSVDTSAASKPKSSSFKDAFAAARKAGDKTFTWQGKSFTTQVKGESKPASRPAARPAPKPAAKEESKPKAAATSLRVPASLALASKGKDAPAQRPVRERAVDYLENSAAKKRAAEKTNFQDKLFNTLGRGSDADARLAQQYRNQMDRERKYKAAVAAREAADRKPSKPGPGSAFASEVEKTKGIYKAKGGKIDGCAVRGKTKAGRKK